MQTVERRLQSTVSMMSMTIQRYAVEDRKNHENERVEEEDDIVEEHAVLEENGTKKEDDEDMRERPHWGASDLMCRGPSLSLSMRLLQWQMGGIMYAMTERSLTGL